MSGSLKSHGLYVVCQALLSIKFSRQEYWSGLPFPSPGDLPDPGIESALQVDSLPSEPPRKSSVLLYLKTLSASQDFPDGPVVKNPPSNAGDMGSLVGELRSCRLQRISCLPQLRPNTAKLIN